MHPLRLSPPHPGLPGWTSPVSLAKAEGSTKVRGQSPRGGKSQSQGYCVGSLASVTRFLLRPKATLPVLWHLGLFPFKLHTHPFSSGKDTEVPLIGATAGFLSWELSRCRRVPQNWHLGPHPLTFFPQARRSPHHPHLWAACSRGRGPRLKLETKSSWQARSRGLCASMGRQTLLQVRMVDSEPDACGLH
jgi:hypothetical protein